jgi:uncharacterized membrane protein YphA (DoxX/SURF4 family)
MLSLFPSLLVFGLVAPFLLRVTLGAVLIFWSYGKLKARKSAAANVVSLIEGISGILLVIGLYTQLAALAAAIIFFVHLVKKLQTKSLFTDGVNYYFILFIIAISLLLLGPGILAFDLPL